MKIDHDKLRIVHQGVDTLRVSFIIRDLDVYMRYDKLLYHFQDYKDKAKLNNDVYGQDFEIFELNYNDKYFGRWKMYSKSTSSFKYTLETEDFTMYLASYGFGSNDFNTAQVTVDFRAKFLFSLGHKKAYETIINILNNLLNSTKDNFKVLLNRIDLATDVMGVKYTSFDKIRFKHTFKVQDYLPFSEYSRFHKTNGYFFGGGDFVFRIYDKVKQIKDNASRSFIIQKWILNDYDELNPDITVWRHEVQYRRAYLKRFLKENVEDEVLYFFDRIDKLWGYATYRIRFIDLTQDELFRVIDGDLKPDSVRQILYRAEKDKNRFHFWNIVKYWDNEIASQLLPIKKLDTKDERLPTRFLKAFLSTAFKLGEGDPTKISEVFDNFETYLRQYEHISTYDYLQKKLLVSYVKQAKIVEEYGMVVDFDYRSKAFEIFTKLQDKLENISDDKDFRYAKNYFEKEKVA